MVWLPRAASAPRSVFHSFFRTHAACWSAAPPARPRPCLSLRVHAVLTPLTPYAFLRLPARHDALSRRLRLPFTSLLVCSRDPPAFSGSSVFACTSSLSTNGITHIYCYSHTLSRIVKPLPRPRSYRPPAAAEGRAAGRALSIILRHIWQHVYYIHVIHSWNH